MNIRDLSGAVFAWIVSIAAPLAFADPPGRVARLAEYAGDVRIATSYENWQPAFRNQVVTAGDNLFVGEGGRAELDVGAVQVWLSGGANVYFDRFDDHNLVARVASGIVAVRIRQWESSDSMRVTTEHGEVSFLQPGLYFVAAGQRYDPSVITTRFGLAELNTFGRVQNVNSGDTLSFDQNGSRFDRFAYAGTPSGGFEAWVSSRNRRIDRWEVRNRGTLNPWMVGVRDLDDHGYWETSYEYGRVWYPRTVAADWAPYRYGRWSWVQPWGWTWVDDAPWGFAPSHYGRWVRLGGRWAWCPGTYVERPVYAPALVSFYGGNGWSLSVSTGPTFAWVPLGWNEPYAPWYTYSTNYWRHVNRPYVRNSAEDPWRPPTHVHASIPGAVTAIAAASLAPGVRVTQNYVRNLPQIDTRSAPPARMGEVLPRFSSTRHLSNSQGAIPNANHNPAVISAPPVRAAVGESAPGRSAPPAYVREGAPVPAPVQANSNVLQPRVWQDPNPVVSRPVVSESPRAQRVIEPRVESRVAPPPEQRGRVFTPEQRQQPLPVQPQPSSPIQERAAPPARGDKGPASVQEPRSQAPVVAPVPAALVVPPRTQNEPVNTTRRIAGAVQPPGREPHENQGHGKGRSAVQHNER